MALELGVTDKHGHNSRVAVNSSPFRIGRSRDNDLCLHTSALMSRHHASLLALDDRFVIDISGRNPSFLNGSLLTVGKRREIVDGDIIGLPEHAIAVREIHEEDVDTTAIVAVGAGTGLVGHMVASSIGLPTFDTAAVRAWLGSHPSRAIYVFHQKLELKLASNLREGELERRIAAFDRLVVDPEGVLIDVVDPNRIERVSDRAV